jgi:hypothetical protein
MASIQYHVAQPTNSKTKYTANNNIIFNLTGTGRSLINNSVRLVGRVIVSGNTPTKKVLGDHFTGFHCLFSRMDVSSQLQGSLESLGDYNRMCASIHKASLHYNDLFNSVYNCQGMVPMQKTMQDLLLGEYPVNQIAPAGTLTDVTPTSFYLRPKICLNNMVNGELPFAKTGDIQVEVRLDIDEKVLFGNSFIGNNITVEVTDLKLLYNTFPDTGKYLKAYPMVAHSYFKTTISSSYANFSTKANMQNCTAFYCNAIPTSQEGSPLSNSFKLYQIPNIKQLSFEWNDSQTLAQMTYDFGDDNREEILTNYIKSIKNADPLGSSLSANRSFLANNDSWGMGLQFNQNVDLTANKLTINLQSDISNTNPYTLYFFFLGLVQV